MARAIRVTGSWVGLIMEWLDTQGLGAMDLRARIERWMHEEIVPMDVWQGFLAEAIALRPKDLAVALSIGAQVQPRHVGVLGYLVLASHTLGEALQAYQHYERLFYGVDLAEVIFEGEDIEIRWPPETVRLGHRHDSTAIAALVTFLRRQVDQPPPPELITFINPVLDNPAEHQAYEDFFQCPVRFNDRLTRVRFPLSYLAIPMPHSDPGLRSLLDRQAQALLLALPDSDPFDRALQQVILKLLPDASATLPRAAQALNMSVRSLQRKLTINQLTWQQLLDRMREQLARQYLADRALSLGDIALLLGYSEQSAFNRSFRRWTGQTPAWVRRQRLGSR
ncbi:MAG: helix-turn-helix domain-containing protein [Pseudomonadales bacterium]|nr:helix-turn-helix domain-containing protein [Pseudomonadales bacterium]